MTDTISKRSTHSLGFDECAVASDKVVSTRKEARSAHVEISKMEVQDEGGWREVKNEQRPNPNIPRVFKCVFTYLKHVPGLGAFLTVRQSSPRLRFSCCSVPRDGGSLFLVSRARLSRRIIVDQSLGYSI